MLELEVKLLNRNGRLPTRAHESDVGWDLYTSEAIAIPPGETVDVPCGISIGLPLGYWGLLIGRSSTAHERGLQVMTSVIDPGYRGEMFVMVHNIGRKPAYILTGDRLAQLVPVAVAGSTLNLAVQVDELSPSLDGRGSGGVGSTGR